MGLVNDLDNQGDKDYVVTEGHEGKELRGVVRVVGESLNPKFEVKKFGRLIGSCSCLGLDKRYFGSGSFISWSLESLEKAALEIIDRYESTH